MNRAEKVLMVGCICVAIDMLFDAQMLAYLGYGFMLSGFIAYYIGTRK